MIAMPGSSTGESGADIHAASAAIWFMHSIRALCSRQVMARTPVPVGAPGQAMICAASGKNQSLPAQRRTAC